MRNGFGLKLLHKFFNLPFLQLQKETLSKQIEINEEETQLTIQELDLYQESDDADYNKFLDNLVNKRRAVADSVSAVSTSALVPNVTSSLSTHHISSPNSSLNLHLSDIRRSVSMSGPIGAGNPIPVKNSDLRSPPKKESSLPKTPDNSVMHSLQQQISTGSQASLISHNTPKENIKMGETGSDSVDCRRDMSGKQQSFMSKIFGNKKEEEAEKLPNIAGINLNSPLTSVEDFIPDDAVLDRSFLEEGDQRSQQSHLERVESDRFESFSFYFMNL